MVALALGCEPGLIPGTDGPHHGLAVAICHPLLSWVRAHKVNCHKNADFSSFCTFESLSVWFFSACHSHFSFSVSVTAIAEGTVQHTEVSGTSHGFMGKKCVAALRSTKYWSDSQWIIEKERWLIKKRGTEEIWLMEKKKILVEAWEGC